MSWAFGASEVTAPTPVTTTLRGVIENRSDLAEDDMSIQSQRALVSERIRSSHDATSNQYTGGPASNRSFVSTLTETCVTKRTLEAIPSIADK